MHRLGISISALLFATVAFAQTQGTGAAPMPAPGAPLPGTRPTSLLGTWTVVGVGVSTDGVQALVPNDRTYMGKTATIAIDHLWWNGVDYHDLSSPVRDMCIGPLLRPADPAAVAGFFREEAAELRQLKVSRAAAFYVKCTSGDWGPKDPAGLLVLRPDADTLLMPWYDGGLLKLTRMH